MKKTPLGRISEQAGVPPGDVVMVLKAIRQPTPKMLCAACAAMSLAKRPTQARVGNKAKHGIRYRAMIDALIGEDD
jgi:hypothetical protein